MRLSSDKLKRLLGSYQLVSGRSEWLFVCPKCKRRKLYVNPSTGRAYCQRCRKPFLFDEEGKMDPWDISLRDEREGTQEPRKWLGLPPGTYPLFSPPYDLPSTFCQTEQRRAQRYFTGRGFDQSDAEAFHLHFCIEGKYQGRILFPVSYEGVIWTFIARDYWGRSDKPKVLHPSSTSTERERMAHLGLDLCLSSSSRGIVFVEGPFDLLSVGSPPGIALHGTTLQGTILHQLLDRFDHFVLFLDPDGPGQQHAKQLLLSLQGAGKPVALIRGMEDDPGALGKEKSRKLVEEAFQNLLGTRV